MRVGWMLVLGSVLVATPCQAQMAAVRGYVYSSSDSTPVLNAQLRFNPASLSLHTDSTGFFGYPGVPPGPASVRVRGVCFLTQVRSHDLVAGMDQVLDTFWLEPDPEVCQEDLWIVGQLLALEDSTPVVDGEVWLVNEAYGFGGHDPVLSVRSVEDGVFRLRVPKSGDHEVRIGAMCRAGQTLRPSVDGILDLNMIWLARQYDTLRFDHGSHVCWEGNR
jgi:hypothetical protein